MERLNFEFDHELSPQLRADLHKSAQDTATAQYYATTEWMLRVAAKLFLRIGAAVALLFLVAWLFLG
jgi:hypothetical protein